MSVKPSLIVAFMAFFITVCGFYGSATAQYSDSYQCFAPDGSWYESAYPCDTYYDYDYPYYDYAYPGGLYFDFDRDHGDRDEGGFRERERGEHFGEDGQPGGSPHDGGAGPHVGGAPHGGGGGGRH